MKKELNRICGYLIIFFVVSCITQFLFNLTYNLLNLNYYICLNVYSILFIVSTYRLNRLYSFKSYKRISNTFLPLFIFEGFLLYAIYRLNREITFKWEEYTNAIASIGLYTIIDYLFSKYVVYRKSIDSRLTDEEEKYYKQSFFFGILKAIVAKLFTKYTVEGLENMPEEPAIYISNHAQAHGPIAMQLYFPKNKSIWCIGEMMDMKTVPNYAYKDFWSFKPKKVKWFFRIISYLMAPLCQYIFKRADALAVYKDARIISTFKETVSKLEQGKDIVIFPECPTLYNDIVNEFQDKFVDVAKLYYKRTGKNVRFVPTYVGGEKIVFGKAYTYNNDISIDEQRKQVCDYLKEEITKLAKELPTHKVIPYLNIGKENYKNNK